MNTLSITNLRILYFILFITLSVSCFSQDLIIKKDGSKIFCKIIREDSTSLVYRSHKTNRMSDILISKDSIQKYYYASTPAEEHVKIKEAQQEKTEKNKLLHITGFLGFANPCKEFGKQDPKSKTAGLAANGVIIGLLATLKISTYFGISAQYFAQQNKYNHHVISDFLNTNYPQYLFRTTSTDWKIKGTLGGIYITFPVRTFKNLSFETNFLVGKPRYIRPEFALTVMDANNSQMEKYIEGTGKTAAFTYFYAAHLRYKIMENVYAVAGLEYLTGKAEFIGVPVQQFILIIRNDREHSTSHIKSTLLILLVVLRIPLNTERKINHI